MLRHDGHGHGGFRGRSLWHDRFHALQVSGLGARLCPLGSASTPSRNRPHQGPGALAALDPPEPVRRYQRDRPGELIRLDIKKLGRFERPGWLMSRGYPMSARPRPPAFCCAPCAGSAPRASRSNAYGRAYRSRRFCKALRLLASRHICTLPYTPKTNGKAERFIQTLLRECAYGLAHQSSAAPNADLPRWLDWFNRSRPHSALLNGLPPLSAFFRAS